MLTKSRRTRLATLPAGLLMVALLGAINAQPARAADAEADGLAPLTGPDTPLKAGDRIVFLGDSITQAGVSPNGYVTLIAKALAQKQKDLDVKVIGAGISGNKVPDLQNRLKRDVLDKKPTVVWIYIGINDVWHSLRNNGTPKDRFDSGLRDIIKQIQDVGATIVLTTPSTIGERPDGSNQLDAMLEDYAAISRKVAADTKVHLCDLRKVFIAYEKEHNAEKKERGVLTRDGVHLNDEGDRFVAAHAAACIAAALKQRNAGGASAAADADGFISLFDGKTLAGWNVTNCETEIRDGVLLIKDGNGFVRSDKQYKNYVLELEWRPLKADKWDSGIYFRCDLPPKGRPWPRNYQVNLLQGQEGSLVAHRDAKAIGLAKPESGAWNKMQITAVGHNASVQVNGKSAWKIDDVAATTGYVGIQVEVPNGGQFQFRNIRIKPLADSP